MQIDLTLDWSLVAIAAIFIINYWVVRKLFLQPFHALLTERESEISTAAGRYEESLARFEEATREMEDRIYAAKKDAAAIREEQRAEAGARRAEVVARTRAEAEEIVAKADGEIRQETAVARERIVSESEQLARLAAEQIIGRKIA